MATVIFQLVGSGRLLFWQILDTKWESGGAVKGEAAKSLDYSKEFGVPRTEFKDFLFKKFASYVKEEGAFFVSEQSKKDKNGNGPTIIYDRAGTSVIEKLGNPEFRLSLKY